MAYCWKDWKAFPCAELTHYRQGGGSVFVQPRALSTDKTFCKHTHMDIHVLCFFPGLASCHYGQGRDMESILPHTAHHTLGKQYTGAAAVVASLEPETALNLAPGTFRLSPQSWGLTWAVEPHVLYLRLVPARGQATPRVGAERRHQAATANTRLWCAGQVRPSAQKGDSGHFRPTELLSSPIRSGATHPLTAVWYSPGAAE